MNAGYSGRQRAGNWPTQGRWNPDELPAWYRKLLGDLAGNLTAWRAEHDPHPRLDPRCDPRVTRPRQERRHAHG
jgi:hypothetical protein